MSPYGECVTMSDKMMRLLILLGCAVFAVASPVLAQSERDPGDQKAQRDSGQTRSRGARRGPGKQKAQLEKLQLAMKQKLNLKKEQERAINDHFERHFTQIERRLSARGPGASGGKDSNAMAVFREDMAAARKAGDKAKLDQLRREFRTVMQVRRRGNTQNLSQLIGKLEDELDAKQRQMFDGLLKKLKIDRSGSARQGNLRSLWRAVMSPEMRLSSEQRTAVMRLLKEGMTSEAEAKRSGDTQEAQRVAKSTQEAVFDELSSAQKSKLNAKMGLRASRKPAGALNAKTQKSRGSDKDDDTDETSDDNGDDD